MDCRHAADGLASFAGANPSTATWRYPLTDHLCRMRHVTGQNKAALARYDYAPYGELMRTAGLPLTVGYTGSPWDAAIGQYFAPFRYYNPQTARWNMRARWDSWMGRICMRMSKDSQQSLHIQLGPLPFGQ